MTVKIGDSDGIYAGKPAPVRTSSPSTPAPRRSEVTVDGRKLTAVGPTERRRPGADPRPISTRSAASGRPAARHVLRRWTAGVEHLRHAGAHHTVAVERTGQATEVTASFRNGSTTTMRNVKLTLSCRPAGPSPARTRSPAVRSGQDRHDQAAGHSRRRRQTRELHPVARASLCCRRQELREHRGGDSAVAVRIVVAGSQRGRHHRRDDLCPGQLRRVRDSYNGEALAAAGYTPGANGHRRRTRSSPGRPVHPVRRTW